MDTTGIGNFFFQFANGHSTIKGQLSKEEQILVFKLRNLFEKLRDLASGKKIRVALQRRR